jgi:hypothetical protein
MLSCGELVRLTEILSNYGVTYFPYLGGFSENHRRLELCQDCICARRYLIFNNCNAHGTSFRIDARSMELTRDEIIYLLRVCKLPIDINIIKQHMPLDREICLLLIECGVVYSEMAQFITKDDAVSYYIGGCKLLLNMDLIKCCSTLYDAETLDLLCAELRRKDISRDDLVCKYVSMADCLRRFSAELQDSRKDDFAEVFPLMIIGGYHKIVTSVNLDHKITEDICSAELIDNIMSFSANSKYVNCVGHYLYEILFLMNRVHIRKIAKLIITKHPQYLISLLPNPEYMNLPLKPGRIFRRCVKMPKYDNTKLVIDNIRQDYRLLGHTNDCADAITSDDINVLIEKICRDRIHHQFMCSDSLPAKLYDAFELVQINTGAAGDVFVDTNDVSNYISKIYSRSQLLPHLFNDNDRAVNMNSVRHFINLISRDARILNIINDYEYEELLIYIYENFWRRLCLLNKALAKRELPINVIDMITSYYIKPYADSRDNI